MIPRNKGQRFVPIGLWIILIIFPLGRQYWRLLVPPMSSRRVASSLAAPSPYQEYNAGMDLPQPQHPHDEIITVGVAVTITGCSPKFPMDGAAVLQHSILNATAPTSKYRYQFYAIYHPNATSCARTLGSLGYVLMEREVPVQLSEIRNPDYRAILPRSGKRFGLHRCC
jgi:hypothetical protein